MQHHIIWTMQPQHNGGKTKKVNNMKATIIKKALATLLLLCATGPIQAQEFVREVVNHKDSYSIVREINEKTWLVSNFHNGECVFTKIEDLNPITDQLYLNTFVGWDSSRVNDFLWNHLV